MEFKDILLANMLLKLAFSGSFTFCSDPNFSASILSIVGLVLAGLVEVLVAISSETISVALSSFSSPAAVLAKVSPSSVTFTSVSILFMLLSEVRDTLECFCWGEEEAARLVCWLSLCLPGGGEREATGTLLSLAGGRSGTGTVVQKERLKGLT